ncbi:MAG: hypothetical protein PVF58_16335 [Candidatus Methanofastidiosia archaeon]|jgi:hypothetical protein
MAEEKSEKEYHKKMGVNLFNLVWSLLDKTERTIEENDKMIHAAHASRYHWGEIGTPLEFERGEWQISRVYSVLSMPHPALYHGNRCLEICQENDITDFDIAFAYEALARAYAVLGEKAKREKYMVLAQEAGEKIADEEDKKYFFSELETIPE